MEQLKTFLNKIPYLLIAVACVGWLAWDHYEYIAGLNSPLKQKEIEISQAKSDLAIFDKKKKEVEEFLRNLDTQRQKLRTLTQELSDMQGTLSDEMDIAEFIKMVVTEAKKVGLTVSGLQPTPEVKKELYYEQSFNMEFKGIYVQLLIFLQRISKVKKIIRTDEITISPSSSGVGQYVEIRGKLVLKTFRYATDVAKGGASG